MNFCTLEKFVRCDEIKNLLSGLKPSIDDIKKYIAEHNISNVSYYPLSFYQEESAPFPVFLHERDGIQIVICINFDLFSNEYWARLMWWPKMENAE